MGFSFPTPHAPWASSMSAAGGTSTALAIAGLLRNFSQCFMVCSEGVLWGSGPGGEWPHAETFGHAMAKPEMPCAPTQKCPVLLDAVGC